MNIAKETIRKILLEKRNLLSQKEVDDKSEKIISRLIDTDVYKTSRFIMCYVDFRNEVKTRRFIENSLIAGKRMLVPYINKSPDGVKQLVASELLDFNQDLALGTYGILEPIMSAVRVIPAKKIDLVVVPGVAFSTDKHRIGFGAGYYDRFLKCVKSDCMKIGIAYGFQVIDHVPSDPHDIPVDMLITEDTVII